MYLALSDCRCNRSRMRLRSERMMCIIGMMCWRNCTCTCRTKILHHNCGMLRNCRSIWRWRSGIAWRHYGCCGRQIGWKRQVVVMLTAWSRCNRQWQIGRWRWHYRWWLSRRRYGRHTAMMHSRVVGQRRSDRRTARCLKKSWFAGRGEDRQWFRQFADFMKST